MGREKAKPKPYSERTDLEKIRSQWTKLSGLHDRTDWSAAVVRAATATEIAVNFAVRREFGARSNFDQKFIDGLLRWANGLTGKLDRLLIPLLQGRGVSKKVRDLRKSAERIQEKRNNIAHRGEFCSERMSARLIDDCQKFVHGIVGLYEEDFTLPDRSVAASTAAASRDRKKARRDSRESIP